jgi:hypothetical protein
MVIYNETFAIHRAKQRIQDIKNAKKLLEDSGYIVQASDKVNKKVDKIR